MACEDCKKEEGKLRQGDLILCDTCHEKRSDGQHTKSAILYQCNTCKKSFMTLRGRNLHLPKSKKCEKVRPMDSKQQAEPGSHSNQCNNNNSRCNNNFNEEQLTSRTSDYPVYDLNDVEEFIPDLPAYEKTITEPTRSIYGHDGNYFSSLIESFYDEGAFWRKNVFKIPSGKAGKAFIKLQTEWLSKFNTDTNFKGIAVQVFMILPIILLQKPSARSKAKDHSEVFLRRIDWFQSGDIERLIAEGREIQRRLKPKKSQRDISKTFSKLMMEGKIHSALRFLSEESQGGIHQLSEKILKDIPQQHPAPTEIQRNSLLFGPICDLRDIRFDIDEKKSLKLPS